jgi:hypothetical protein
MEAACFREADWGKSLSGKVPQSRELKKIIFLLTFIPPMN